MRAERNEATIRDSVAVARGSRLWSNPVGVAGSGGGCNVWNQSRGCGAQPGGNKVPRVENLTIPLSPRKQKGQYRKAPAHNTMPCTAWLGRPSPWTTTRPGGEAEVRRSHRARSVHPPPPRTPHTHTPRTPQGMPPARLSPLAVGGARSGHSGALCTQPAILSPLAGGNEVRRQRGRHGLAGGALSREMHGDGELVRVELAVAVDVREVPHLA